MFIGPFTTYESLLECQIPSRTDIKTQLTEDVPLVLVFGGHGRHSVCWPEG